MTAAHVIYGEKSAGLAGPRVAPDIPDEGDAHGETNDEPYRARYESGTAQ